MVITLNLNSRKSILHRQNLYLSKCFSHLFSQLTSFPSPHPCSAPASPPPTTPASTPPSHLTGLHPDGRRPGHSETEKTLKLVQWQWQWQWQWLQWLNGTRWMASLCFICCLIPLGNCVPAGQTEPLAAVRCWAGAKMEPWKQQSHILLA